MADVQLDQLGQRRHRPHGRVVQPVPGMAFEPDGRRMGGGPAQPLQLLPP